MQRHQSTEFTIRARVLPPFEVFAARPPWRRRCCARKAGSVVVAPGAVADLLVVDGDPLTDLGTLLDQGAHLLVIMQAGRFYKNRLAS